MNRQIAYSLMLACAVTVFAGSDVIRAEDSATQPELPAAPKGFDTRRENVD